MSRRKQAKPQHLHSAEPQPARRQTEEGAPAEARGPGEPRRGCPERAGDRYRDVPGLGAGRGSRAQLRAAPIPPGTHGWGPGDLHPRERPLPARRPPQADAARGRVRARWCPETSPPRRRRLGLRPRKVDIRDARLGGLATLPVILRSGGDRDTAQGVNWKQVNRVRDEDTVLSLNVPRLCFRTRGRLVTRPTQEEVAVGQLQSFTCAYSHSPSFSGPLELHFLAASELDTDVPKPAGLSAKGVAPPSESREHTATLGERTFNCCYPGCQFKTVHGMKDLDRHLRIHTGDKPHKCEFCDKCFSQRDSLTMHMWCHKCHLCTCAAVDSSSLKKHLQIHLDKWPYKCQLCPYASRNSSQLTVHLRLHTGDTPFQCLCSAKFKISSDLKRHMIVHSGEKPFKCEFCDVRCTMKANLKSHIRIKHTFKCLHCAFQGRDRADLLAHSRLHQADHPEKCPECSYSCSSAAALRVHSQVHCKDRPFRCDFCSFDTKRSSSQAKHIDKVHRDEAKTENRAPRGGEEGPREGGSPHVARVVTQRAFRFFRGDSLRCHRKQHSGQQESKDSDLVTFPPEGSAPGQLGPLVSVGQLEAPLEPIPDL
ncbi:LOW QUALITY PROTEIN: zinc finger protein 64-like [Ctenodactylus gundi]